MIAASFKFEGQRSGYAIHRPRKGFQTSKAGAIIAMDNESALQGRSTFEYAGIRDGTAQVNDRIEFVLSRAMDRGGGCEEVPMSFPAQKGSRANAGYDHQKHESNRGGDKKLFHTLLLSLINHLIVSR